MEKASLRHVVCPSYEERQKDKSRFAEAFQGGFTFTATQSISGEPLTGRQNAADLPLTTEAKMDASGGIYC